MNKNCVFLILLFSMNSFAAIASQDRIYDCAANSLYLFCALTNSKITYEKSLELLPITEQGNSMLEVDNALKKCGFETKSIKIKTEDIVKVKSPSIVLHYTKKTNKLGHYFIIIPHDNKITIYDYPDEVQTYPVEFLISSLKQNNINDISIITCSSKKISVEDKDRQKFTEIKGEILFKDFDKQPMGILNFGKQPEGGLVRCSFIFKNKSSTSIDFKDLKGDCKCSKVYIDKTHVSSGDSCKITMEISLAQKYKDTAVKAKATINQSDGTKSTDLLMLVKGYSAPRVLCVPEKVNFGTVKTNSGLVEFKGLKILKGESVKGQIIDKIKPTASYIKVFNTRQDMNSVEFDIGLQSNDSFGMEKARINVFLENESDPANYFDVTAMLQQDYAISPKVAIVKKGRKSVVTITPKEQKFTVEKVLLNKYSESFNVEYSNKANHSSIYISISDKVTSGQLLEDFAEAVVIWKDTGEQRVLKIPILYIPEQ